MVVDSGAMVNGRARIEIEGRTLAWRSLGEGSPLLLVNGYAATGADWDPTFLAGLAQGFEVICPDNRGLGGSELGDARELSVDSMAADLEALLEALSIERLPAVGWSMGGFVAQRLALRAPARAAALALIATDPGGPEATPAEPEVWAELTDHSGSPREQASRLISLLFPAPLAAQIDRQFGGAVAVARAHLSVPVLQAQEAAMESWHLDPQPHPDGAAPSALVLHGEEDRVIPAANAAPLAARWHAEVELFAGAGHGIMAQEPERLATLLTEFLSLRRG
jgi:pimeloyl-ACP methyl ester carboxylesterase